MDINYNKWKEEKHYVIQHQLIYEAERELLKREESKSVDLLKIGDEIVAGISKKCEAVLRLSTDNPPAIVVAMDGKHVGTFFLKDVDDT